MPTPRRPRILRPFGGAILALALVLGTSGSARAGFDEGWTAYQKADFGAALKHWQPLAEEDALRVPAGDGGQAHRLLDRIEEHAQWRSGGNHGGDGGQCNQVAD